MTVIVRRRPQYQRSIRPNSARAGGVGAAADEVARRLASSSMAFLDRMQARPGLGDMDGAIAEDESEGSAEEGQQGSGGGRLFRDEFLDPHPILLEYLTQAATEAPLAPAGGGEAGGDEDAAGGARSRGDGSDSEDGRDAAGAEGAAEGGGGEEVEGRDSGGTGGGGEEDIVFLDVASSRSQAAGGRSAAGGAAEAVAGGEAGWAAVDGSAADVAGAGRMGSGGSGRAGSGGGGRAGSGGGGRGFASELRRMAGVLSQVHSHWVLSQVLSDG